MLKTFYTAAVRQPRWIKQAIKRIGTFGIAILSRSRRFVPAEELSVMSLQMLLGTWDRGVSILLKRTLQPGMTVVDVGAHVGYFALEAAHRVGSAGRIFAFEPEKENYAKLVYNTKCYPNITTINAAAADSSGSMTFYTSGVGSGRHSLVAQRGDFVDAYEVRSMTLDKELKDSGRIDLVKIDVEGAECRVLKGMESIIKRDRPHLVVELYPAVYEKQGLPGYAVLSALYSLGYTMHVLDDDAGSISAPIAPETFEQFVREMKKKYINLYAEPRA